MATIDLGKLGFVNKGTYNNSTTYEKNDLVQFTDGGILSTYLYIDSTAQSGQAPSSSGTAGSRWVYFAKGVADAVASAGNNKVLVTNASGNLTPLSIGTAGQVVKVNSGANGYEFGTISTEVVNTTMTAFQDAVNAGDRKRNPYVWTRYNTAVTVTDANNYFLWEVNGFTNHDNHPAASVEVQEDSGSFVNAYNKSTLTGTAIVQASGQSTWNNNDHLSRYPHMRFDTAVNTNNNYAQPSSAQGIYKPTGTPTTLNFRVSFWSENSTGNLIIGANPSGGSSHGCPPLSYLKITEIKA